MGVASKLYEWTWVVAALAGTLLVARFVLGLVFFGPKRKSRYNLPPGPPSWPLIGNMPVLMKATKPLHYLIDDLSKVYGPIMMLKVGVQNLVFVSNPELTMAFLKEQDHLFAYRPANLLAGEYLLYGDKHITIGNQGDYHTFFRKLVVTELLTPKRIQSFLVTRKAEQDVMFSECYHASLRNEAVDLHVKLSAMSLNIISQLAFSRKFHGSDTKAQREWTEIIPHMTESFGLLLAESCHPSLRWVDSLTGNRAQMQNCFKRMDTLLDDILLDHTRDLDALSPEELKEYEAKDFMDLALLKRYGENSKYISDASVKAVSLDLIVAGSESITSVTEWALAELLINPHVLKKAQDEIDSVIGKDRLVTEADASKFPYIHAILKETFRIHEPLPWLLPHSNRVDCKVGGFDIPAGSFINVNVFGMSRSPELWEDPLKYKPERFLSGTAKHMDVKGAFPQLMPFGGGRRICPGIGFAHTTMHTVLARLLHAFDWSIPNGQELDMGDRFGAVASKVQNLVAVPTPRLAPHVYKTL